MVRYSLISVLASCQVKARFQFTSGWGAVLAIDNDTITSIDPPWLTWAPAWWKQAAKLRHRLRSPSESHVFMCLVHFLSQLEDHYYQLEYELPVSGVASVKANLKWVSSSNADNFKPKVNKKSQTRILSVIRTKESVVCVEHGWRYPMLSTRSVTMINVRTMDTYLCQWLSTHTWKFGFSTLTGYREKWRNSKLVERRG